MSSLWKLVARMFAREPPTHEKPNDEQLRMARERLAEQERQLEKLRDRARLRAIDLQIETRKRG